MDNFYDILGVPQDAQSEDIKRSYRAKISLCHPDKAERLRQKAKGDPDFALLAEKEIYRMEEESKLLNQAKDTLLDPTKRKSYDQYLKTERDNTPQPPIITLSPSVVSFGKLETNKSYSKSFQILNSGGNASSVNIDWENKPTWGEFTIEPNEGSDPFPIKVTVNILVKDTAKTNPSTSIITVIDKISYSTPILLEIVPRVVLKPPPLPRSPTSITTLPSTTPPNIKQWITNFVTIIIGGIVILAIIPLLTRNDWAWDITRIGQGYISKELCAPYIESYEGPPLQCQYGIYRLVFKNVTVFLTDEKDWWHCTTPDHFDNTYKDTFNNSIFLSPPNTFEVACIESIQISSNYWKPIPKGELDIKIISPSFTTIYSGFRPLGISVQQ